MYSHATCAGVSMRMCANMSAWQCMWSHVWSQYRLLVLWSTARDGVYAAWPPISSVRFCSSCVSYAHYRRLTACWT